jgi:hypothetical protein
MNAARIDTSPRLQRVKNYLSDGLKHSTMDIIQATGQCAINSIAAELRDNGFTVNCERKGHIYYYQMPEVLNYLPPNPKRHWRERDTYLAPRQKWEG